MFVINQKDTLVRVTRPLAHRLGRSPDELINASARTLVVPADEQRLMSAVEAVRQDVTEEHLGVELSTADGDEQVRLELFAREDGTVVGSVHESGVDDSASVPIPRENEKRFGDLFELTKDAVVVVEMVENTPIVRSVNPAFVDIFGYAADAVIGESLNDFIVPPEESYRAVDFDKRTADGDVNRAVVRRQAADGIRRFLYRGIPYEDQDGGSYGLAVYTDVTDQQRREQQLDVLHRVLRHNIRNAMTVIQGAGQELQARIQDPDNTALLEQILRQASNVIEVSRKTTLVRQSVETGQTETAEVTSLLTEATETLADFESVTLSVDVWTTGTVAASTYLPEAIACILENAAEHGGEEITLSVDGDDEWIHFAVADDGSGIPEHERGPVFENDDTSQLEHGSSVGLWLAKWTAEAVGGQLSYSREEGWTTVTFTLPRVTGNEGSENRHLSQNIANSDVSVH